MTDYFISNADFPELVNKLLMGSTVFAPVKQFERHYITGIIQSNIKDIDLFGFRTVEPFKSLFFAVSEVVSLYFKDAAEFEPKQITILGARGCDLEALEVLDRVFGEGEFKDPFYLKRREKSLIIGADCTDCGKTCFCTLVGGQPYPLQRFDLNLSLISGGYVVTVGSEKGKKLIDDNKSLFPEASEERLKEKEDNRKKTIELLSEVNKNYQFKLPISETYKRNLENPAWKTLTKDCVECSSCNLICPTCTCFFLADEKSAEGGERLKLWDTCLKSAYQKVAGGSNPRGKLSQRLQNRYHCKMDYSFDRLNRYTCVGCGRCIDGCAGNIDMRKIFAELERQVPLTAKLV